MTDVKVYAGNAGPFLHGCVRYETADITTVLYHTSTSEIAVVQQETNNVGLVVGLSVGLSVLIIFLVIVAVLIICKRRGRNKQIVQDDNYNEMEMSPASSEHRATDGPRVER